MAIGAVQVPVQHAGPAVRQAARGGRESQEAPGDSLVLQGGAASPTVSSATEPGLLGRLASGARRVVAEAGHFLGAAGRFVRNVFDHQELWKNPALPPSLPDRGELSVASYNILLGGRDLPAVEASLRALDADVVCLQEASLASVQYLARRLGYHVAFATTALHDSGKAILSKYPIAAMADRSFRSVPFSQRLAAFYHHSVRSGELKSTEPLGKRSILHATIQAGGRSIEILDTHLSLGDAPSNAEELAELADYSAALVRQGRTVVAAGDFNTNFGLVGTTARADAPGTAATPTDTVEEFRARYPRSILGNVATAEGRAGAERLLATLQSFWDRAQARTVLVGGVETTPEAALAELASGRVAPGSERYRDLRRAADGLSHIGASKRFDNVFASGDLRVAEAVIDQTSKGSDHQPVLARLRWE